MFTEVASLLLVAMSFAPSSFLFLVASCISSIFLLLFTFALHFQNKPPSPCSLHCCTVSAVSAGLTQVLADLPMDSLGSYNPFFEDAVQNPPAEALKGRGNPHVCFCLGKRTCWVHVWLKILPQEPLYIQLAHPFELWFSRFGSSSLSWRAAYGQVW